MFPPSQGLQLDIEAVSGICGSISIACWVVVFSPQIIENFRRGSAEGLSIVFLVIWLAGDVFNILGAVLQRVLPTMIILAVYYTFADIVLLGQCFYYRGFTLKDTVDKPEDVEETPDERSRLLSGGATVHSPIRELERRLSGSLSVDGTHLSPANPLIPLPKPADLVASQSTNDTQSALLTSFYNVMAILLVCGAGVFGWWLSYRPDKERTEIDDEGTLEFDVLGQIFGYICAALYLGSRIPQLLLNYRRKSTEGISLLFFLFACIGNLTYVLSIFAYSPICHRPRHCRPGEASAIYGRYILVNFSWLLGSFGTLLLDLGVFVQFFLYKKRDADDREDRGVQETI